MCAATLEESSWHAACGCCIACRLYPQGLQMFNLQCKALSWPCMQPMACPYAFMRWTARYDVQDLEGLSTGLLNTHPMSPSIF
jgi:hypothetical protein